MSDPTAGQEWKSRSGLRRRHRIAYIIDGLVWLGSWDRRTKTWREPYPVTVAVLHEGYEMTKEAP